MRYSRQREKILADIKGRKDHPTAEMVYASVRESDPKISLGTVYRNLRLLKQRGEIVSLETADKRLHYDGDTRSHGHFICSVCGRIYDVYSKSVIPKELKKAGVTVTDEKCIYYGFCGDCKAVKNK